MANLLKGKCVADAINENSIALVNELKNKNITPTLATFRIGGNEADIAYESNINKRANNISVKVINNVFDINIEVDEFINEVNKANLDKNIHGILIFRPLPFNEELIRNLIVVEKDVDGSSSDSLAAIFTNTNKGFAPCTAEAAMKILDYYNIDLVGKNVAVIGRSLVVGKPLSMLLLNRNATVTICHSKSKNIASISKKADIVIAAIGKTEMLNKDYFSNKQTVIDVGINYSVEKNKLCGDVLFEEVERVVEYITSTRGSWFCY